MTATALFSSTDTILLPERHKENFMAAYPSFKPVWWLRNHFIQFIVGFTGIVSILLYVIAMKNPVEVSPEPSGFNQTIIYSDSTAYTSVSDSTQKPVRYEAAHAIIAPETTDSDTLVAVSENLDVIVPGQPSGEKRSRLKGSAIGKMPVLDTDANWDQLPFQDDKMDIQTGSYTLVPRKVCIVSPDSRPYFTGEARSLLLSREKEADSLRRMQESEPYQLLVYEGKPFKKLFENMVFISKTQDIANQIVDGDAKADDSASPVHYNLPFSANFLNLKEKPADIRYSSEKLEESIFQPFYFMKSEVSNLDYREFIYWVVQTNGFQKLNLMQADSMPEEAFVYQFHNQDNEYVRTQNSRLISIMPKRDVWSHDFPTSYNVPMDMYYLAHPAYSTYPVVGVSYWQSLAYLDWLSWIWQSRLDAGNIPYRIEFDLPHDYERELAIAYHQNQNKQQQIEAGANDQLLSNLAICGVEDLELRMQLGFFSMDKTQGAIFTTAVSDSYQPQKSKSEIVNLDGNVSEWCKDGYQDNYVFWRENYRKQLAMDNSAAGRLLLNLDDYFMDFCDTDGKLVRGANFYDQRYDVGNQDKRAALYSKTFVSPEEQHATIGFRAVVRVKLIKPAAGIVR